MKIFISLLIILCLNFIKSAEFCPNKNLDPPKKIQINESFSMNPVIFKNENYTAVKVANKIFLNSFKDRVTMSTSGLYNDVEFCPSRFKIPLKSDYESVISQLGKEAYNILTDPNGFKMIDTEWYLTNTRGDKPMEKIFMHLDGKKIKFESSVPSLAYNKIAVIRCIRDLSDLKLKLSNEKELNIGEKVTIATNSISSNGFLWRIGNNIFETSSFQYSFTRSGANMVEFWGNCLNGEIIYLCDYIYVKKKAVSNSQDFNESKIKKIETDFKIQYSEQLHFQHANCPVAPRINGGYYIAFTDESNYLHVLSFNKDNQLLKDFNTTEKAYPFDIISTDYGFAIYKLDAVHTNHSYLSIYNKNFDLVNTVQIMNNGNNDDQTKDSNTKKQVMKYKFDGSPILGMRFMFRPDNGKLLYSKGIILLIFNHYNYFLDLGEHNGDSSVTFNNLLQDMNIGLHWGASHSLIQTGTFDEYNFCTASLSDGNPEGIKVIFTSKTDFKKEEQDYDPILKKYNSRAYYHNSSLAGSIKGYGNGSADGRLGGLIYFENLGIFCMVYAKTPNVSEDNKNGKHIIYMTTWKFSNNSITEIKTTEIKVFDNLNIMQVRAGKYGNDKVFIMYTNHSDYIFPSLKFYGSVPKGTIPKVFVIDIKTLKPICNDKTIDTLIMNTNEELRTFHDGVLIWASANSKGNLVINKVGDTLLDESYDDISYIMSKNDLIGEEKEKGKKSVSLALVLAISLGVLLLLIIGIILLRLYCKKKKDNIDFSSLPNSKLVD